MNKGFAHIILSLLAALMAIQGQAQSYNELLGQVASMNPGKARAGKYIELSEHERRNGHLKAAVQFAIQGAAEAEKNGLNAELGQAFMALAEAHRAQGDLENAIGSSTRATMVKGNLHTIHRTNALLQLADLYLAADLPQKAMEYLNEAQASTAAPRMDRTKFIRLEARAKASVLSARSMVDYCRGMRGEVVKTGDQGLLLDLLSLQATAEAEAKMNRDALNTEQEVLKLAIALDRPVEAGISSNNVGELNLRMGQNEAALQAFGKALIMVEDIPYLRLSMLINAANAQAATGNINAARRSMDDAERLARKGQFTQMMPRLLRTKAAVEMVAGDLEAAQNAALEGLGTAQAQANAPEEVATCDMLAEILERRDLPMDAKRMSNQARAVEKEIGARTAQAKMDREAQLLHLQRIEREHLDLLNRETRKEDRLRQLAVDAENRDKALALLTYEKQLEEAARREAIIEKEKSLNDLKLTQAALDAERQNHRIQELDNNRMLQSLSLSKLELERKEQQRTNELLAKRNELVEAEKKAISAQREHDLMMKRYYILLVIASIMLAAWMAWSWYVARRKKQLIAEKNAKITLINAELARKNHDIKSSILYAQGIQAAILPTEEALRQNLPDSFLLYKPLDIVSGDLPFMRRIGDLVYVAAIDCTGHGVPAAMMTFIAYYGLNDLLAQGTSMECSQLLDKLHLHVKQTMEARNDGNLYNDGFDIGLCRINLATGELSFAGAQLPLIIVRGGEATRIKGDILPLGDSHFKRTGGYREHKLQLASGDSLFLFSDGIIHQFGGDNGKKKFSLKRLTELLRSASEMDLASMKDLTDRAFNEWKGGAEQTDDVLLIGMRYAA